MDFDIQKRPTSFSPVSTSTVIQPPYLVRKKPSETPKSQPIGTSRINYSISNIPISSVQTKLTIGSPGDRYEQEADHMASQVMSMSEPTTQPSIQREGMPEEEELQAKPLSNTIQREGMPEEEELQAKFSLQRSQGGLETGENLESQLSNSKGGGSPLSSEVQSFMEPRFGADFSQVRVHTDSSAVQMSQSVQAQAFTHGSDIYFGSGKSPGNNELTAHELTHVVQQTGANKDKL